MEHISRKQILPLPLGCIQSQRQDDSFTGKELASLFEHGNREIAFLDHFGGDLEFFDFLIAGKVIHQVEHQLFEDHAQAARADFAMQGFLGDGLRCVVCEKQVNALIFKEFLILLEDSVARLGENLNQRSFVEFIENAHDRESSNKLGDQPELDQVLRLGLAQ